MMAAYGIDVLDPGVTARRIHVLATQMPPHQRMLGEQWGVEAHLLATLVDCVQQLTWVTLRANGSKASRPKPMPRPGRERESVSQPASGSARRAQLASGEPVKAASWVDAARMLAGSRG